MDENILIMLSETRMAGVVHLGTRLTRYIYDELSFLYYPTPCGSVVDVNSLDYTASKTRDWYRLLPVFLGVILLVQAGSAKLEIDASVSPENLWIGNSVTVTAKVYDSDYPGVPISNGYVHIEAVHIPAEHVVDNVVPTNASGWAVFTFTPTKTGKYSISPDARVNYSINPGLPSVGFQYKYGTPLWINVSSKAFHVTPVISFVLATTTPSAPTTTTPVPAVTTTQTTQQTTPVVQVTQVTQVTQALQALPADKIPPVTTLTAAGTEDGSGGYNSDVICTLTAADNAGGGGVKVIQYSFDGTSWYTYSQPVSVVKAGLTTLYYRSADNAGNLEVAQVKVIMISTPGAALAGEPHRAPGLLIRHRQHPQQPPVPAHCCRSGS